MTVKFSFFQTSLFCLVQVTSYELHYYPRVDSTTMLTQLVSVVEGAVPTNHTLHGLSPFTEYVVMVRMHGYYRDGMGGVQMVVSNFSNFVTLQTQEDGKVKVYIDKARIYHGEKLPLNKDNSIL